MLEGIAFEIRSIETGRGSIDVDDVLNDFEKAESKFDELKAATMKAKESFRRATTFPGQTTDQPSP